MSCNGRDAGEGRTMQKKTEELMDFISKPLRAAMLAIRAIPEDVFDDYRGTDAEKEDYTVQSIMDLLSQIMVVSILCKLFPQDGFVGEETITEKHLKDLGSLFAEVPGLRDNFGIFIENPDLEHFTTTEGAPCQWILDPVDGTSNFKKRPDPETYSKESEDPCYLYGFSLACLEEKGDASPGNGVPCSPKYGITYAPEYQEATYKGKRVYAPMLVHEGGDVSLYATETNDCDVDWKDNRIVVEHLDTVRLELVTPKVDPGKDRQVDRVVLRDSKSEGPNPFYGQLQRICREGNRDLDFVDEWDSTVVGLSMAVLGHVGIYGGTCQLWDHAAVVPMIQRLGGQVFRYHEQGNEPLIEYQSDDIETVRLDKKAKLRIVVAFEDENIEAVEECLRQVQQYQFAGGDNRPQPKGKPNDVIVTLPGSGEPEKRGKLWYGPTKQPICELPYEGILGGKKIEYMTVSPNGQHIFFVAKSESQKAVWDLLQLESGALPVAESGRADATNEQLLAHIKGKVEKKAGHTGR